jgi:hypothetical protein
MLFSTTTILARLFLEPDAARATSTPSRYRNDDAKRDWCTKLQAAATTSRHVVIAAARSMRCD